MTVRLEPWGKDDLPLLEKTVGDPEMMVYLGGPESAEKMAERQVKFETGWFVLPAFQGRGIAVEATAQAIVLAKSEGKHRYLHAFPAVENGASNAICRKLGFTLIEAHEYEYPSGSGNLMQCNDWRLDLRADT